MRSVIVRAVNIDDDNCVKMKFLKTLVLTFFLAATAQADLIGHHAGAERFFISGDGAAVSSISRSEMRFWDVSRRALRSTLSLAKSDPNGVLGLSGGGRRLLRREKRVRRGRALGFRWVLWRQVGNGWQSGSVVAQATLTGRWPLALQFVGQELFVLWPERVERFGSDGSIRLRVKFENPDKSVVHKTESSPRWSAGSVSPNGESLILSQGKLAVLFSATSGHKEQRLALEQDYGIYSWYFAPDGLSISGWNSYQADNDERSPMESDRFIWNTQTGKMICHLKDVNTSVIPQFWMPSSNVLLEALCPASDSQTHTFQARNACNHEQLFTFPRSWPSGRSISQFEFSNDGKTLIALDRTGDIWVETL